MITATRSSTAPAIWKQLDYPDAPELLCLLMLGGVDRDFERSPPSPSRP
jgi:hypothetical protein